MKPSLNSSSGSGGPAPSSANTIELAREKLRQAEDALKNYLHGCTYRQEEHKRLVDAVRDAREAYVNELSAQWPEK